MSGQEVTHHHMEPHAHAEDEQLVLGGNCGLQHQVLPHGPQSVEHKVVEVLGVGSGHLRLNHGGHQVPDTPHQTLGASDIFIPRTLLTRGRP